MANRFEVVKEIGRIKKSAAEEIVINVVQRTDEIRTDARIFYQDSATGTMKPTKKGLALTHE